MVSNNYRNYGSHDLVWSPLRKRQHRAAATVLATPEWLGYAYML